jgi:hypothetical protein
MNNLTSICAFSKQAVGRSHVAVPNTFSGRKEDYRKFQQQIGLFLMANQLDFLTRESMVLFALLYMKEGTAELWANSFVDWALEEEDWGTWEAFLDALSKDFGDAEELQKGS